MMSTSSPIKDLLRPVLDIAPFQQMIVELNEKSEEALSAGAIEQSGIKYPVIVRCNFSNSTKRS